MNRCVSFFLLTLTPVIGFSQGKKITDISVGDVRLITIDRAGELYIVYQDSIEKYDINGKLLNHRRDSNITSFDTGNGVRVLLYQKEIKQYRILSPTLAEVQQKEIDPSWAIEPVLLCSSGDYNFWILDEADYSLKKVDGRLFEVLLDFKLDTTQFNQITQIKEYQNFLFTLDPTKGISVYNSMGQHLQTIESKDIKNFNFLGQELYYLSDQIYFIDLFTGEKRTMPVPQANMILMTDIRMFALLSGVLSIYEFNP